MSGETRRLTFPVSRSGCHRKRSEHHREAHMINDNILTVTGELAAAFAAGLQGDAWTRS